MVAQAQPEVVPALAILWGPHRLRERTEAEQQHVLHRRLVADVLCPHVGLPAQYVRLLLIAQRLIEPVGAVHAGVPRPAGPQVGDGVKVIYVLDRQHGVPTPRFMRTGRLAIVKVAVAGWGHDHIMPHLCCNNAAPHAPPGHDCRAVNQPSLQNLIPAHQLPPLALQEFIHATQEPALQLPLVLKPLHAHALLTLWALSPLRLRHLIAADVNIAKRKYLNDLIKNSLQKLKHLVVPRAVHGLHHAPLCGHLADLAGTAQLRVGSQRGAAMPWHFDLRHDMDEALPRIRNNLSHLVLGVIAPVPRAPSI
mmetsp:Transcript_19331/g.34477  ORF Transcript_19331/g.34477 Transcript_19331/m.34477 type:complete len:308 (+) Transcript_19331:296-1219(+)